MSTRSPQPSTLLVPALQLVDEESRQVPDWPIQYTWLEPDESADWLEKAGEDEEFKNRKVNAAKKNLMCQVMRNGGFVHFLPDGPFVFDEHGVLMNGKLRLTAAVETVTVIGVIVFRNVPRDMFPYLGTGVPKTYKHVRESFKEIDPGAVDSVMRRVLMYEEVLAGLRPAIGWQNWSKEGLQPADQWHIRQVRADVPDYYGNAAATRRGCKLSPAALMMFQFYQWHAWPEGRNTLEAFLESLESGGVDTKVYRSVKDSPAVSLRNFGRDEYCPTTGKVEIQLILLFNHFEAFANDTPMREVKWAYGMEMRPPYHPKGPDAAKRNLRKELVPLNLARGAA